jgi:A/G-specific adenine glycosylase
VTPSAAALLAWYDRHRRDLPWRGLADPYRIWLSEVMLQQTTVATVGPRYARFLARFPDVATLAAAPWDAVAQEWAGLGYYARARNLHAAARLLAARGFPRDAAGLADIPGIGPYTAAAIAAIAFDQPIVPLDGNVERVTARLHALAEPLPAAKPMLRERAQDWMRQPAARARPGDLVQALFDLGATICTPRAPACALCPLRGDCAGQAQGIAADLPRKAPRRARPRRHGVHFAAIGAAGALLLVRRPPKGLLGGMLEMPGTPWREAPWTLAEALAHAPFAAPWAAAEGEARHGFTHFELSLRLLVAPAPAGLALTARAEVDRALPRAIAKLLPLLDKQAMRRG